MDLRSFLQIVARRWYVVVPVLVLTVIVAAQALRSIEPTYNADGSALLLGPSQGSTPPEDTEGAAEEPEQLNPYVEFTRSVQTTAVVIAQAVSDDETATSLRDRGFSDDYTIEVSDDGPILEVEVTDTERTRAVESVAAIFEAIGEELEARQAEVGAPEALHVRSEPLTTPTEASEVTIARDRALAAIVALGFALMVYVALTAERIARVRRDRARLRAAARSAPAPPVREPSPARTAAGMAGRPRA